MHLEILTPEKRIFDGEVTSVNLPGSEELGSFTVLNNHAPIISTLKAGRVIIKNPDKTEHFFYITGGFVEVLNNHVSLLAEGVREKAED